MSTQNGWKRAAIKSFTAKKCTNAWIPKRARKNVKKEEAKYCWRNPFQGKLLGIIFVGGGSTPPPSALPSPEHEKINSIINNLYIKFKNILRKSQRRD